MKLGDAGSQTTLGANDELSLWAPARQSGDLIADLLRDQADLTAVERFSQYHDGSPLPAHGRYYSALIPAAAPGPGQQYGFEVDLDRCSGCKACVAGCHSLNGLDENEAWRDVGMLIGGTFSLPVIQHVTSACHHCVDPACLNACPVDAYEKDPITGIVRHLDDQCFGCQYCTLACPYDVPKFHAGKGIVRKCDMCGDRLAAGEAPACVQACPHEAISITIIDVADIKARAEAGEFLAGAPSPSITQPSTVFLSRRSSVDDDLRPADEDRLKPEHAHTPLVAMLVLTQLSVGGFLVDLIARLKTGHTITGLGALSLAIGFLGLGASLLHLGRPLYAYRAILGIRHSWLSREVAAFGLFIHAAMAYVAANLLLDRPMLTLGLLVATVLAGLVGVGTSMMVYHVVKRPFWAAEIGGTKFYFTTLILGFAASLVCLGITGAPVAMVVPAALALMLVTGAKLVFEAKLQAISLKSQIEPLNKSARLLDGVLKRVAGRRLSLGIVGGIIVPLFVAVGAIGADRGAMVAASVLVLPLTIAAELCERWLFFTAVVKSKMPGGY